MHLVYISTLKQDFIGESEIAAEQLMGVVVGKLYREHEEQDYIKLENVSIAMNMMDQQGRHALNQRPFISSDWFTANLMINPKYIIDIRSIGKDSPLRKSYKQAWKKASAENSGITLVKAMPQNLPPTPNIN